MADNEEGMEGPPRGNEWEVVSLTASAYAAAPGPKQVELNDDDGDVDDKDQSVGEEKGEASETMFMSHHFVFPPSQHENLPVEVKKTEIHNQLEDADVVIPDFVAEEGCKSNTKDGENWDVKALNMSEEFSGTQFVDDKGKILSVSGTEFEDNMTFEGLNVVDKEQSIYSADYSSAHGEATMGGSIAVEENRTTGAPIHLFEEGPDSDISPLPKSIDNSKDDDSQFPSEAWWKRRAAALYAHAKETNAVWSIFIAAAVMGLVILGQRWQQERWQVLQHKSQFGSNDEKVGRMLGPLSRLKDAIVGGHRRGSVIRGSTTSEH